MPTSRCKRCRCELTMEMERDELMCVDCAHHLASTFETAEELPTTTTNHKEA